MHAASVNPEPGSNSRNHSILTSAKRIKSISSLTALSLLFLELYSLSELRDVLSHLHALYSSLTVQFSKTMLPLFRGDSIILPRPHPFVNTFFRIFLVFLLFCTKRPRSPCQKRRFWAKRPWGMTACKFLGRKLQNRCPRARVRI